MKIIEMFYFLDQTTNSVTVWGISSPTFKYSPIIYSTFINIVIFNMFVDTVEAISVFNNYIWAIKSFHQYFLVY